VLQVRPGITGLTQIQYRHEESLLGECSDPEGEYLRRIMPEKLAVDLKYIETRSLLLDLRLLAQTGLCLFARDERARHAQVSPAH
jgi:lipopolysaccharide/colanic/teichoic acid biosynthesis glycosyltransferase